jgi:spermidine/putrescine transport system ATP-binding protein
LVQMPVALRCTNLRKRYPGSPTYSLGDEDHGVDLEVRAGEFFALLGPSGCGKTTTLRIIGGFVEPSAGSVVLDDIDVTNLPPYRRSTNTVFQNYALFPHLSIADNVAFGLAMSRVAKRERVARVADALDLVGMGGTQRQRPGQLSGGQAQRVALARAMILNPAVLLLDEPLGALDLKLRRQMQTELVRLRDRTGGTFIHVTHDQEEACAIADRLAIMNNGRILQIGTPKELYRSPRDSVVAEFIDAGSIIRGRHHVVGDVATVQTASGSFRGRKPHYVGSGLPFAAVLAPNCVRVRPATDTQSPGENEVLGQVNRVAFQGNGYELTASLTDSLNLRAKITIAESDSFGDLISQGRNVILSWDPADVMFVEDTGQYEIPQKPVLGDVTGGLQDDVKAPALDPESTDYRPASNIPHIQ